MAKNYVIDGGTGELDVGGNTLANRFDLPDKMAMNPFSEGHMPGAPEVFPMPNTPDLLREEGIQVGEQVRVPQNLGQRYNIGGLVRKDFLYGSDDVKKIKELRKKGRTSEDIGKLFKRSGSWVEQIVRKHKLPKQTIPLGGFSKGDFIRGAAERPSKWLIDYSRADLAKDLKAGKTLNEISEDLYAKHKFDYDKIPVRQQGKYKTTPVAHILSSLNSKIETKVTEGWNKEVLKENKALRNLADQNQAKYNRTVKNIKTDINNFISSNKAKYKKLYQTDTLAPKKFYKAILDMVEKKYPKFIKVSEGAIYGGITKGEKILPIFQDAKGGQYGHKLAITRVIDKAIGNVSNRKNVAWEKTYIDAVKKLLPLAQEQGLIDKTYTNRSGKKVKLTPERYQLYMRQTLTNPLAKIFGKNIIWSPEHMGGITRAGILNDPKALAHVTPMESGSLNKLKGVVSDKKLTGVIRNAAHRIDEPAFVRKQLVTANRLSKEAFDKYGVRQATYSYDAKNKRINTKYPKLTLGDSLLAKTKGAIHNFIANGSMKKPIFKQLPEKLQQGIKLINQGKNANKILSSHLDDIIPNWKGTKGLTFNNFAGAISLEGLPSGATQAIGKAASALGKGLKVLGVASLPLDTIPFAQQMERGLGTRSLDTGAMRWIEDLINAPKNIAQVFGGDLDYEERTFGRKYADKVAGEIGEEKITENIDQLFEGSEKIGDPMYDALGEYSFAARSDDRQKVKDKALTPFFEETETEEFELDPISKRVLGQPQLEFAGGGSVEPRIEYRDGTRMSPQPPKEKSFEEIIKELQIQYGIPDEEGFAVKDKLGRLGDIVDVRNYPYYGSKVGKGIMEAAEFSVRFPGAAGQLIHDVATGPGWKEQGLDFIKNVSPGWGWSEKVGLDSLIDEQVGAMKERGSSDAPASLGGVLNLGADIAMPLGYVYGAAKFGKFIKALGQTPDKISDFNKRIIDHLDSTGQSKRDFMTLVGTVGAMGAIKAMGLDKIFNVGKVIKGADDMIPMVKGSYSTMPKWFPMFIQKINPKMIYEGDGMSTFTGTDDFLPGIKVEKNGDDYLIHGQNEYGQNWSVSYEGPRWLEIEPGQKPIYFKGEFEVVDEVPVGRRPEDVEFEPEVIREIDELLGGNGRSMEEFATGKEIEGLTKGEKQVDWAEGRAQQAMDEAAELEAGVFDEVN